MLDYSGYDKKAQEIAIHYSNSLADEHLKPIIAGQQPVTSAMEATAIAEFYWCMLDQSALDEKNGIAIAGELHIERWMQRLLNIFGGYLENAGYAQQWEAVCDRM
ncbi:hypothetical protein QWY82_08115 [Simiduia curdlanivorans]|uniref:Uncharacterized protein n=1 Tax=Simiduia curdlanivorans TaxID=1492769 RepID=A0ABV8V7L1_9GAMM|nr:hypothetical protein [Simiduia curdlanivorans]MDN3638769.1 hypothetical protein [Simiduia curdlanivorans]